LCSGKGQFDLRFFNLADISESLVGHDKTIIEAAKHKFCELRGTNHKELIE